MNRAIITNLVTFILGGGVGYLVAKKVLEEKYADFAQDEIDSVRDYYERKAEDSSEFNGMTQEEFEEHRPESYGKYESKEDMERKQADEVRDLYADGLTLTEIADKLNMSDEEVKKILEPHVIRKSSIVRPDKTTVGSKVAYNEMAKEKMKADLGITGSPSEHMEKHNVFRDISKNIARDLSVKEEEPEDEPGPDMGSTARDLSEIDRTQPYEITAEEYNDEFVEHDKVSIYYYMEDDVLCDENEEIVDDVAGTVGYDCFKTLENQSAAWVRNEPLAIDYEICVIRSSYSEVVHGVNPKALSPREQYQNRQRRRGNSEE